MTAQFSDAGGVAQQPRFCTSELPLAAFSATPPASEVRAVIFPRVPPRFARVSPAVTHGAPPPEAALCGCESRGGRVGVEWEYLQDYMRYTGTELDDMRGEYPQDHMRYTGTELGDAVSGEYLQDHIRYVGTELGDAVSGEYLQDYIRYVGTVVGDAVSGEYLQDYIRYMGTVVGDAMSESIRKTIYDMRGWR